VAIRGWRDHRDDARSVADRRVFALTRLEFNTTSIAAILTIVGYSLNETVVVLDRIREMMRKYRKMPTDQLIDVSVNAVIPRTIMTATTVFLALISLVVFGGEVIRSFSLAMIWGIFVATYSSIFICSPMLIYLGLRSDTVGAAPAAKSAKNPA
jgi:preprotein translocase subunit SecF